MAKEGGFFSPNRKTSGKNKQVASSMSGGSYGGYVDAGESRGFVSPEQADRMLKNPGAFKMRPSETRYLRDSMGLPRADAGKTFFSPSGNEVGQIASATTDLGGMLAQSNTSNLDSDEGYNQFIDKTYTRDVYQTLPGYLKRDIKDSYRDNNPYQKFNYKEDGQLLNKAPTDTKIAMDNLGGYAAAIGGIGSMGIMGINAIKNTIQNVAPKFQKQIEKRVNPEQNQVSLGDRVGSFFNKITGTQPVAAGTLDDKPTRFAAQVSPTGYEPAGPKLNYVNPDAKTMTMSQIGEAFKPSNLFGYKDKFGRYDDPGSPLDRQRQETMQNVYNKFTSPIVGDPRTIAQIRADQKATMQENAKLRNEAFKRGETPSMQSADVTYNTNMYSNPAYGFSGKMSPEAQKKYAESARYATEAARPDPSLGNVMMTGINKVSGFFGGPQGSLESIGERQLRLANKEINRPTYQKEAYARKFLGITNDQLKARNLQQIRENAFARNQAFKAERAQRAVERAAIRRGGNIGTGRDGGFGLGTTGQGMPSNPKGFSGYSRKSSPGTGTGTGTGTSSSRGGISKSTSRGQGGGPSSRSKGGTSKGGSKAKSSGSRGQGGGSASRSKGGTGTGSTNTSRKASKASKSRTGRSRSQCDIRTKIDISSLTNQNLVKDDLATVAYFVQEIKEK